MPAPEGGRRAGRRGAAGCAAAAPAWTCLYHRAVQQPADGGHAESPANLYVSADERSRRRAVRQKIIATLARRAYRRPVANDDIQPLSISTKAGRREKDFDAGIERAVEAILASPEFLIRLEREPAGATPGTVYR